MPPLVIDVTSAEDTRDCIHRAVQALAEGKLVAFPTETVYALAASALNEQAVARLLSAKRRLPGQPPLTLGIKSADEAIDYVPHMSPLGQRLARRCWPGPVTMVCANHDPESLLARLPVSVRDAVSPGDTVGLRVPGHAMFLDTLRMIVGPVVLTSANRTGQPDPLTAQEVVAGLGEHVALVLDDGRTRFGQSSSVIKIGERGFEVIRAGVVSEQTLRRFAILSIVFVCTGNTCRSPMAESLCRNLIAAKLRCSIDELEDRGVAVSSAGISATMGGRPSPEGVAVMSEIGIDLSYHESQPLRAELVRHADIIWTMTRAHRQAILSQWPEAAPRVHVLSMDGLDVSDPIGGPVEQYRRCAEHIKAELEQRLKDLQLQRTFYEFDMKIAVGSDHRGFDVKTKLMELVAKLGHEVIDAGCFSAESCDYPDVAAEVARKVGAGEVERGILICGSGIGMCIAANKVPGVRAAPCHDDLTAEMSRRHNDLNVLCLSADMLGERLIDRLVEVWLTTAFEGGRHSRRIEKIAELERSANS